MFIPLRAVFILLMMLCITGEECWGVGFYLNYAQEDCWMFLSVDPEACAKDNFQFASIDMYIKTCFTRTLHTQFMWGILKTSSRTHDYNNLKKTVAFYYVILLQKYQKRNQCLSFFSSKPCILNCLMQNLIVPVVK